MTPKKAIVLGVIASGVYLISQFVYYQGQSKVRFFKNGIPLAGAEMRVIGLEDLSSKKSYTLDDQGGYDFGWSWYPFKKDDKWIFVSIRQGTNEVATSFMRLPSGSKSLDFCPGSVLKSTNIVRYFSFVSSTEISESWPLTNTPATNSTP
ncbi:MAG TPA: hypothetical protein VGH19_20335 [Verrucomicrobiae bacterium]